MRLKVETFFKVEVWDKRYLLTTDQTDWIKGVLTNQGLDRIGDGYWISGIHIGGTNNSFSESDTGIRTPITYISTFSKDTPSVVSDDEKIEFIREVEVRAPKLLIGETEVNELSLSWDSDSKTATSLCTLDRAISFNDDSELVVKVKVVVTERLDDIVSGEVDLGASLHQFQIRPCYAGKFQDAYIGTPLVQKEGRVYSGPIPADVLVEPEGSIDINLGVFEAYSFDTRSKVFKNFFTLSSPNADTRIVTSHTIGLPSAFAVQFDPPIDKEFNRELTLNFKINWDRGE